MNTAYKWLLLILLFAAPAFSQNVRVDNVAFSSVQGFPFLPSATITICTAAATGAPCTPTVAGLCLSISDTTCNQSPTITADALGNYGFWIQPGSYTYTITKAGFGGFGPKALTLSCQPASSCMITGPQTYSGSVSFTGAMTATSINNVQMCDQFAGATADLKIAACITALPAAGGVADARGIIGTQSFASTLVVNKTLTLLLGAVKITGPASGAMIDVQAQGVVIRGVGSMQNTGATQGTVLVPVTSAQADGIHLSATGAGNVQYKVADLTINDSTAGGTTRTAGVGIHADANVSPAQNSIGEVDNVFVSFMFTGILLNRPITSTVLHATSVQSKQDDFDFQGDGTSTWCIQCYGNFSGRHNYGFFGLNYSGCIGCASDHAVQDGYHVARLSDTTGAQSIVISITNSGAEVDSTGGGHAGIYCLDCVGFYVSAKVLNAVGQGIWIDGGRTVTLSGFVTGSTNNDVNVTQSATPVFPSVWIQNLQYVTTGGGAFSSANNFGYNGSSTLFQFGAPPTPVSGAVGSTDLGTAALPWTNFWLGTAATNNFKFQPAATAAARTITIADPLQATVALPLNIASGTKALNTAAITTATCDAGVAATATGALSTDTVSWSFNAAPTATNKYGAFLVVYAVPSANTVTFYTCNPSATTSTPTAMTVNWSVERP